METTTTLLSILAALGLAAACGFRVFVPLFVVSLASRAGALDLSSGFAWIGSTPAVVCFGTATLLEVLAYYVPVIDNLLDSVATPAAVVAGVVVAAAVMTDIDPWLKWTLATVAGGGLAAAVQFPDRGPARRVHGHDRGPGQRPGLHGRGRGARRVRRLRGLPCPCCLPLLRWCWSAWTSPGRLVAPSTVTIRG